MALRQAPFRDAHQSNDRMLVSPQLLLEAKVCLAGSRELLLSLPRRSTKDHGEIHPRAEREGADWRERDPDHCDGSQRLGGFLLVFRAVGPRMQCTLLEYFACVL